MPIQTDSGLKLTYEDYVKIPADGRRHEIIDGRHVVNPAPRPRHQIILGNLHGALLKLQESGRAQVLLSPVDVQLSETDIVQPDLVVFARRNVHRIGEVKIDGPPDLAVEILSPSTRRLDRGAKRALYEAAGVIEYWIVDPDDKMICQHTLVDGRHVERLHASGEILSTAFADLAVELAAIFR